MKVNNVLIKRSFKEYGRDFVKFGILQIFMIILFTLSCGYIVGTTSVDNTYRQLVASEVIEDGNFDTFLPITSAQIDTIEEKNNIKLEEQFYHDFLLNDKGHSIRVYKNRSSINIPNIKSGRLPENSGEIAILDLYSSVNNVTLNSKLTFGNPADDVSGSLSTVKDFTVVGIVSFPDYVCIYQNSTDTGYKQRTFAISVVTDEDFAYVVGEKNTPNYGYTYRFNTRPTPGNEAVLNLELKNSINQILYEDMSLNFIKEFTPQGQNRCIFTGNGFAKQYDALVMVFLYIMVVVIAFAFGISTISRINEESKTMGTLRASGYTRGNLVGLYSILPLFIVITSAIIGDLIGFFVFAPFFANIFLGLLSLPTVSFSLTGIELLATTIIPALLMLIINVIILVVAFKIPVKRLLTGEVSKPSKRKSVELNEKSKFTNRFKKRIFLQNISNFIVLFIGISLGSILFTFGISYKTSTNAQVEMTLTQAISEYQYILNMPQNTAIEGAEELLVYSMSYQKNEHYLKANISIFGIIDNSEYVHLNFEKNPDNTYKGIYISSAFAAKYNVKAGESIRFTDPRNLINKDLYVNGIYQYEVTPCVFAPISMVENYFLDLLDVDKEDLIEALNLLDITLPHGYLFNSYYTNDLITDINKESIKSFISKQTIHDDAERLNQNANAITALIITVGIAFDILLMYLLIKQIIDKNKNNIAMCKILGFSNPEITKLYIQTTSIVAVISLLISLPLSYLFSKIIFVGLLYPSMLSYMILSFPWWVFVACFACGLITYLISTLIEYRHIKRISMVEILKS